MTDASGHGNTVVISGARWTSRGLFGQALVFNGTNSWVTINEAPSLDLTTGMTLDAWVYPTGAMTGWRNVIVKEQSVGSVYSLTANSDANQPATSLLIQSQQILYGGETLVPNIWMHLAATYDGTTQRLYLNGLEVANRALTANEIQADMMTPVATAAMAPWQR